MFIKEIKVEVLTIKQTSDNILLIKDSEVNNKKSNAQPIDLLKTKTLIDPIKTGVWVRRITIVLVAVEQ